MNRFLIYSAVLLTVGLGSSVMADEYPDDLNETWFYVLLLHDANGMMVDYGWFHFWVEDYGPTTKIRRVSEYWCCGGGYQTAERIMVEVEGTGTFGPYGSSWGVDHSDCARDSPYAELDWVHCKRWATLIGHALLADGIPDCERRYTLHGWQVYWPWL